MTPDPTVLDIEPVADQPSEPGGSFVPPGVDSPQEPPGAAGRSIVGLVVFLAAVLGVGLLKTWWIPAILAGLLFTLFMHELGHYITARMSGMKVTEFFLGFGPRIWSFKKGETEYGIKAIPAGAYVRIIGMTNLDDIDPADEHRTYRAQPYWQRMMTICAGSAMHFLMATIALFVLFSSQGYAGFNGPPWVVNQVVEGSTASALGIEVGDSVRSVNGETFANWDEFGELISNLDEGPVAIVIERDGQQIKLEGELGLRPRDVLFDGFGLIMLLEDPDAGWEVARLWPTDPAEQFGLEQGDELVRAGGVERPNENTMAAMLRERNGEEISIEIVRDGEPITLTGTVMLRTSAPFRGFFGVGPEFVPEPAPGTAQSALKAVGDFGVIAKANLISLGDMVNPARWLGSGETEVPRRAAEVRLAAEIQARQEQQAQLEAEGIESPDAPAEGCDTSGADTNRPLSVIGIGRLIACSESADQIIFLFAVVNIFIGIFNLFPVLPVDGGHAAVATYERIRSLLTGTNHRVDASKLIPITWLVIFLLVGVGVWTTTLDIFSWPG